MTSETKTCQNCQTDFIVEPEEFSFFERMKVPAPTFCPECRSIRRMLWWNEHTLYKRECGLCKKQTISIYAPEYPGIVYCNSCWFSDDWDRNSYGREYDFSKPFFVQFNELMLSMPLSALNIFTSENCQYNNYMSNCKDCYLCFRVHRSQDMLYTYRAKPCSDCTDCLGVFNCQWLYSCIECVDCNNSKYLEFSNGCIESAFLYNCHNCMSSFMCSNLRNKQYCFMNEQLTKEEYQQRMKGINFGDRETIERYAFEFKKMKAGAIRKYALITNCQNVTGDNIRNSKNCRHGFDVADVENGRYLLEVLRPSKDVQDVSGGGMNEMVYEFGGAYSSNAKFSFDVAQSRDMEYCQYCEHDHDMFGCLGLWHKEYCILNKQYAKEEYEELIPKIIKHMNDMPYVSENGAKHAYGECFPSELSPFAYNESYVQNFFPLTKEEALGWGFRWREPDRRNYEHTIAASDLPKDISEATDNILKETIGCAHGGKCPEEGGCRAICTSAFKIIPAELQFYKKMNIPLPTMCPNCRQYERSLEKNPTKLWHRSCMCGKENHFHGEKKCEVEFETSYAPDRPEMVYCEKCYQQEIY